MGEVLGWVRKEGGVEEMERRCLEKSNMIYSIVEGSGGFYSTVVEPGSRWRLFIVHSFLYIFCLYYFLHKLLMSPNFVPIYLFFFLSLSLFEDINFNHTVVLIYIVLIPLH